MNQLVAFIACLTLLLLPACREQSKEDILKQGLEFSTAGNHQAAISVFKDALERDPSFLDARLQLGSAYYTIGKLDKAEIEYEKAQRQDPQNREIALKLAQIYMQTSRAMKALALLQKLEAANPDDAELLTLLAQVYSQQKNYPVSEEILRRALQLKPKHLDAQLSLAQLLIVTERKDEGERLLKKAISENPDDIKPHYLQFGIALKNSDQKGAIAALQHIIAIKPEDIFAAYNLAMLYVDGGKVDEAKRVAADISTRHPEHPFAARILGLADYRQGNYQPALAALQKSLVSMPDVPGYYFAGLTLYQLDQLEQAVSSFQKALDTQPDHVQSRLMLAQAFLKQGRTEECIQSAQKVLAKQPSNALAHNLLGSAYLVRKQYDLAMTHLDKAIELDPSLAQAHVKKGLFNLATGNQQDGVIELQNAVEAAPDIVNNRLLLATYYLQAKNYHLAIKTLKEGLRDSPDSALIYNYLAAAYFAQKNTPEALASLNRAKSLKPDYLTPYFNLANYHVGRQDYPAAINELQQALKVAPNNLPVNLKLAGLCELTGDKEGAESHYKQASTTGPPAGYLAYAAYLLRTARRDQSLEVLRAGYSAHSDDPTLIKALGVSLQAVDQSADALKMYSRLEEVAPGTGTPLLIAAHLQKGNVAAANEAAAKVVAQNPSVEYGYLLQATIHEYLKEWIAAEDKLQRGIAMCKKDLALRMKLASMQAAQGKRDQSLRLYDEILREQPKFVPATFAKGALYDLANNKVKAMELYKAALELDENYAPAMNNLAYLQIENFGKPKEALQLATRAFRLMPEDPGVIDTLGYALLKNGQADRAISFLEKAARLKPQDPSIQDHLAQAYKATGKDPSAARIQ